jgi:hypothetical protein
MYRPIYPQKELRYLRDSGFGGLQRRYGLLENTSVFCVISGFRL